MNPSVVRLSGSHAAIARGELARAKHMLSSLLRDDLVKVDAEHALAVVERRLGNLARARAHFQSVLRQRPGDPHVHNNLANCLRDAQEFDTAVMHYRLALEATPDYPDALINLGLTLRSLEKPDEAHTVLRRATEVKPDLARAWHSLGMVLRDLGKLDEAAAALDHALSIEPDHPQALHARALTEAELGKPAVSFYRRAQALAPEDPEVALGHAIACFDVGDEQTAEAELERLTTARPDWVRGHAALAHLRWKLGDTETFARSFDTALDSRPQDTDLFIGCFGTLMRAGKFAGVLDRLKFARQHLRNDAMLDRYEAVCASESGDLDRAERAFSKQSAVDDRQLQLAHIRHLLRTHRPRDAAQLAESIVGDCLEAWPYLGTAWRLTGDSRSQWLTGDDHCVMQIDLPQTLPNLVKLAEVLRGAHRGRNHPFDQSLRGGTQSDGNLFSRSVPELRELRGYIEGGVRHYISQLPPRDEQHPFLRQPRRFEIAASYSVLLSPRGFHVNHVHPDAWISCCFYVDIPDSIGDSVAHPAGWLALGQPPVDLGLDLAPLRVIKPVPGRLVMFPSTMWHGTVPFSEGQRLTVVSDLVSR